MFARLLRAVSRDEAARDLLLDLAQHFLMRTQTLTSSLEGTGQGLYRALPWGMGDLPWDQDYSSKTFANEGVPRDDLRGISFQKKGDKVGPMVPGRSSVYART